MKTETIQNYILYLIKECGLSVSLHPMSDETLITCSALMNFNIHDNPYCSYIKSLPHGHERCLAQQKKVFGRCRGQTEGFCGVCHAGVVEYVYPIRDEKSVIGFLSVSGYACRDGAQYAVRVSEQFGSPLDFVLGEYHRLKPNMPDKKRIDTLLLPLCEMLELAYIKQPKEPKAESLNEAICRYIQRHYSVDLTAEQICKHFSCSKSYFSHSFKRHTGQGFREYLTGIRLNYAKQLLEHSHLSVTQISFSVGFNDSNYFSNVFRQKTGMSPLRYRKMMNDRA